jgi:hypothetical protein
LVYDKQVGGEWAGRFWSTCMVQFRAVPHRLGTHHQGSQKASLDIHQQVQRCRIGRLRFELMQAHEYKGMVGLT